MTAVQPISPLRFPPTFLLGIVSRVLQGFAAFAPVVLCKGVNVDWGVLTPTAISAAAVASGMGLGAAIDRRTRSVWSAAIVVRICLALIAVGLWLLWLQTSVEFTIAVGFLLGAVTGTEWSSQADVTRKSLHNTQRWHGVRYWTVAFFVGVGIAIALQSIVPTTVLFAAAIATLCFALALRVDLSASEDLVPEMPVPETLPEKLDVNIEESSAETTEACDATDCCGGSKSWTQASFNQGVLLSILGWFVLFGGIRLSAEHSWVSDSSLLAVTLACGFVLGGLLIFSVAPSTGYAVSMLPFLLLAILLNVVRFLVEPTGFAIAGVLFVFGLVFGAVHCASKLMIGELFSDCSTDPFRTRVVVVSLFATSVLIPCSVAVEHLLPSGIWQSIPTLIVLTCGLATLRNLPSPVVSSLGDENPDEPDMDELEDVMATINN